MELIDKSAVVAELERRIENCAKQREDMLNAQCYALADDASARMGELNCIQDFLDKLEVKDPYEQCILYPSIKDGIESHAEIYSFNIESKLFNQLTKEQQKLWRKEIEQACISGGEAGVELARDIRYKENVKVKEVDLEKEIKDILNQYYYFPEEAIDTSTIIRITAKRFFEFGLKAQKGE